MNLDQYMALHVRSSEMKMAHNSFKEQERKHELVLEDLLAQPDRPVTGEVLHEALESLRRLQQAHLDTVLALIFHDKA